MEFLYAALFGLVATAVMTSLLYLVNQSGSEMGTLVKGIGSAVPTPAGGSQTPGVLVHVIAGLAFAYLYEALGRELALPQPGQMLALGDAVGIVRGIVVSAVLALLAFDQEPMEHMTRAGMGVGTVHVLGNVVYGLCVSALFGLTRVEYVLAF